MVDYYSLSLSLELFNFRVRDKQGFIEQSNLGNAGAMLKQTMLSHCAHITAGTLLAGASDGVKRSNTAHDTPRQSHSFPRGKYDFDAWGYNINWPQHRSALPLLGKCSVAVEDIKFAFNAWMLLRLCMFYGLPHPTILSNLRHTTPSMDIADRGNRLFYMHSHVGASLRHGESANKIKVALTPSHPRAISIEDFPWKTASQERPHGIELVLGMENGMSEAVSAQCDYHVYIPQYGSIGSLSMLSALSIAVHHAHMHLVPVDTSVGGITTSSSASTFVRPSTIGGGQQPSSSVYAPPRTRRPHDPKWDNLSNEELRSALGDIRASYPMKLSVLVRNEIADRNIGATVRNANVFNCDEVLLFNRKKFSMRGTVGTHHYTPVRFFETRADVVREEGLLDKAEVWLLQSHYPYLQNFYHPPRPASWIEGKKGRRPSFETFIRPEDSGLAWWASHVDPLHTPGHPLRDHLVNLDVDGCNAEVFLDSNESILAALERARQRGCKGIILACPEEGTTPHPELASLATRIAHIVHPSRLSIATQRGLSPALKTAPALERIRAMMACMR